MSELTQRTLSTSFNATAVNLTAVIFRNNKRTLFGARAHAALPHVVNAAANTALIFVHGYRHRSEWRIYGRVLQRSASESSWLVSSRTSLLLYSNDHGQSMGQLLHTLQHDYPSSLAAKYLIKTAVNVGYRCGHLHALALTTDIWKRFGVVLFSHPDVFLLPPAPTVLGNALSSAIQPSSNLTFLACRTKMFHHRARTTPAYLSDLFAFLPSRLLLSQPNGRLPSRSSNGSAKRTCPADAPPCRGAWNPVAARSWNAPPHHLTAARSFWETASDDCTCGYCEGRGLIKPEMALFNALSGFGVETHGTLIARTTGYRLREMSREGVWHTHNTTRVAEYLKTVV